MWMRYSRPALVLVIISGFVSPVSAAEREPAEIATIYLEAAALAAGDDHQLLQNTVCPAEPRTPPAPSAPAASNGATPPARVIPPVEDWYREPARVFDELYFVGTDDHASWAVVTDEGIMLLDTVYDYATGEAVVGGLTRLGFDPADIELVIISHGHGDHHGGARFLQDEFGARIVMGAADWDLVEADRRNPIPRRDITGEDGMSFTLGDTTITVYETPGHTYGTLSSIITVQDGERRHTAAYWGGTSITTATPADRVQLYIDSAVRFSTIAERAGADVLLANHLIFDGSREKLALLASRQTGQPHPYVVGFDTIRRYLAVAENCARAELTYR